MKLKRTNKLLALLLAVVMVMSLLPGMALPALADGDEPECPFNSAWVMDGQDKTPLTNITFYEDGYEEWGQYSDLWSIVVPEDANEVFLGVDDWGYYYAEGWDQYYPDGTNEDIYFDLEIYDDSKVLTLVREDPWAQFYIEFIKGDVTAPPAVVHVTSVTLDRTTRSLKVDETATLKATIKPAKANKNVSWSSDNPEIASVDKNGVVTAKSAGKATITVTTEDGGLTASCQFTIFPKDYVYAQPKMAYSKLWLHPNEQAQIQISVNANCAEPILEWSSKNEEVATVDQNGVVTALKEGTAEIWVQEGDVSRAYCYVYVLPESAFGQITVRAEGPEGTDQVRFATVRNRTETEYTGAYVFPMLPGTSNSMYLAILSDSVDADQLELDYWKVNGVPVKSVKLTLPGYAGSAEYRTLNNYAVNQLFPADYQQGHYLENNKVLQIINMGDSGSEGVDWEVVAVFKQAGTEGEQPLFTPTVTAAETGDASMLPQTGPVWIMNAADQSYSTWKLFASPRNLRELDYIQLGDDETTRVYSEDGETVQWNVTASDAAYTAYFKDAMMHISSLGIAPRPLFSGQQARFGVNARLVAAGPHGTVFHYALYSGEGTDGALLAEASINGSNTLDASTTLIVDPMPADVTKVTLTTQINDGTVQVNTYDVEVLPSGTMEDLEFLPAPSEHPSGSTVGMLYPSDERTGAGGPNVYDVAAFRDEETGALSMYFAVNGGVMEFDAAGAAKLTYMSGMAFPYNDTFGNSGFAFAVGGQDKDHLYAIAKATAGNFNEGVSKKYCIYALQDGTWTEVSGSKLTLTSYSEEYKYGLVMSQNDMWVFDQHWDGTGWLPNSVKFNSFWKENATSAYAGSSNGIYHYDGENWSLVSGTSGTVTVNSAARNTDGSVTIMSGRDVFSVKDGAATAETLEALNQGIGFGVDEGGAFYGFTHARHYVENAGSFGYYGSYVYQYDDGTWAHQLVPAFNDPAEDDNINSKIRPDGVDRIVNPCEGVSLFLGKSGAIYVKYGKATISFETNGGSKVSPITQTIGSRVTPPTSPTRDGYTFMGWFTLESILSNGSSYKWSVMPVADLTLYAKWAEQSGGSSEDPYATERKKAQESLDTALSRLTQSDYDASTWVSIQSAYNTGTANIANAEDYDGIYDALNSAVDQINRLSQNTSGTITVAVTVEKFTIDGEYIIEPTLVTAKKFVQASVVLTDLLKEKYADDMPIPGGTDGKPYTMTGTETSSFYLAGIWTGSGFLSEFDGGIQSGWMYCINGEFPGVGASGWTLTNGDVMRWQYTCTGLGSDIGADNTAWGSGAGVPVADKDALIWKIAEINQAGTQSTYGNDYTDAMTVLKNITATQADVNAALAALNKQDGGNASTGGTGKKDKTYQITVAATENGTATASAATASEGEKITVTAKPADGYELDSITVKGEKAGSVEVKDGTFTMPADDVTVTVKFMKAEGKKTTAERPFTDVNEGDWFYDAVYYCFDKGYFKGTSETGFEPQGTMTRAMFATVLWRIAGQPAAKGGKSFSDVEAGQWYADAVAWASGEGILDGYGGGAFGTNDPVTREQIATMLYRYIKTQGKGFTGLWSFQLDFPDAGDVSDWATEAMSWMVMQGVINGMDGKLNPQGQATRAQVAAIMQRMVQNVVK